MEYTANIVECSKELTSREKLKYMTTEDSVNMSQVEGELLITPDFYCVVEVHNEKSQDVDYTQYHVIDKDGTDYYTGSQSFWNAFKRIFDVMSGEDEEYQIKVLEKPSNNIKDRTFLTCTIV